LISVSVVEVVATCECDTFMVGWGGGGAGARGAVTAEAGGDLCRAL